MKKRTLSAVLALGLGFSAVSCGSSGSKDDADTVKIVYLPITHSLAVLEEAEELQKESGLKVELIKYGSLNELLDALNSNRVDGASVLIELAMKSKQEGIGVKAVALGHHDGNVIVVSNDIGTAADLKGKTFASPVQISEWNFDKSLSDHKGISVQFD